jgi:hypothetical protein
MTAANDLPSVNLNIVFSDNDAHRALVRRVMAAWDNPPRDSAAYVPKHVCYRFLRWHPLRLLLMESTKDEVRHKTAEFAEIADMFLGE